MLSWCGVYLWAVLLISNFASPGCGVYSREVFNRVNTATAFFLSPCRLDLLAPVGCVCFPIIVSFQKKSFSVPVWFFFWISFVEIKKGKLKIFILESVKV